MSWTIVASKMFQKMKSVFPVVSVYHKTYPVSDASGVDTSVPDKDPNP
jgi:hypothetical protein